MINNVVLVSGVQQSDSVIHIHVSILFQILFPPRLLQNIVLYGRSLLFIYFIFLIYFKYSSVYMSIPNSQTKAKVSGRKEIIKTRAEINEIDEENNSEDQ